MRPGRRLTKRSPRNPVVTGEGDQLLNVGIRVIPELDGIWKVEWVPSCHYRNTRTK